MTQVTHRVREYLWVTAPLTLAEFCDQLSHRLHLPEFDFDGENVWEWSLSRIENNYVEVNISRKHKMGEPLLGDPLTVLLLVGDDAPSKYDKNWIVANLIPKFGQAIANLTKQPAYHGEVKYLGGDDFAYESSHTFQPQV